MKSFSAALVAVSILFTACSSEQEPVQVETTAVDATAALHQLFDDYFERNLELNPVRATAIGDYRHNDRLAITIGPEYREASNALDRDFLARLLEIDAEALSHNDRISYELFKLEREQSIEGERFPGYLQPINQFQSMTNFFVQMGSGTSLHPFKTVKDFHTQILMDGPLPLSVLEAKINDWVESQM